MGICKNNPHLGLLPPYPLPLPFALNQMKFDPYEKKTSLSLPLRKKYNQNIDKNVKYHFLSFSPTLKAG